MELTLSNEHYFLVGGKETIAQKRLKCNKAIFEAVEAYTNHLHACNFLYALRTCAFSWKLNVPNALVVILYAIQKAKGTDAARKRVSEALKAFFNDPENRRKRSISMKGFSHFPLKVQR